MARFLLKRKFSLCLLEDAKELNSMQPNLTTTGGPSAFSQISGRAGSLGVGPTRLHSLTGDGLTDHDAHADIIDVKSA